MSCGGLKTSTGLLGALCLLALVGCSNGIDLNGAGYTPPINQPDPDPGPDTAMPDVEPPEPDITPDLEPGPNPEPTPDPDCPSGDCPPESGIDLAIESLDVKQHPNKAGRLNLSADVINQGDEGVDRTIKIGVEVWHATQQDAPLWSTFQDQSMTLAAGETTEWGLILVMPETFGSETYQLVVTVDADAHINDIDRSNNNGSLDLSYTNLDADCPLIPGAMCPWFKPTQDDLTGLTITDAYFVGADFSGLDLSGSNLDRSNLTGAILRGANLSGTFFNDATLAEADAESANMAAASFERTDMTRLRAGRAILSQANLRDAIAREARFDGSSMDSVLIDRTDWTDAICPDGTRASDNGDTCEGHLMP